MHCDGDSDNSDESDCKASNTGGTDDEEEHDDGEDADDCDAAESRRTMQGDKRFFLPKVQGRPGVLGGVRVHPAVG